MFKREKVPSTASTAKRGFLAALLLVGGCATTEADREAAAREMQVRLVQETADWRGRAR